MKNIFKTLTVLLIAFIVSFSAIGGTEAHAATKAEKKKAIEQLIKDTVIVKDTGKLNYTNGTVKAYISLKGTAEYNTAVTLLDAKTVVYYKSSATDMLYAQYEKIEANGQVGEKLNDITDNITLEANTGAAATMLSGFQGIIELLVGVVVVLIAFGMTVFTSLDIVYIAFPVFRNKCEDAKQSGNQMMTKKSANGDVSLRWITDDAQYAITQGTIDSGKSPWTLYFKKRVLSYIFLGIILFILLTGNISIITNIAINVVSGVMDILSELAS